MNYYISERNVSAAVEYFKSAGFDTDDSLFLFLLSKHMGVTMASSVTYGGGMSAAKKDDCLNTIWMLGGLFDSSETCEKRGVLFPTGFSRLEIYQPGSSFSQMIGRVRDTIKQKNVPIPIYTFDDGTITLKNNYKDLIRENYLKGNKISLSCLTAWMFRFTSFDFEHAPNERQFTRVIEKTVRKKLKITKNDFLWLFENDLSTNHLVPSEQGITGAKLRELFPFGDGEGPEIRTGDDGARQVSAVQRDLVERYLTLNGDNPSDEDIFDILKTKKQIVLTGVPGVGKSRYTKKLCDNTFFSHNKTIQFHSSYSYEDFIGSEILENENGGTYVTTRKGTFLDFVDQATNNPGENYLFVIDELNRGNIAEIFGETILALDREYTVDLNREYENISQLKLPDNLFIVATMNTSDRNIAFLDLAIRRRFAFVSLLPNYDFLSEEVAFDGIDLGNVLRVINQRILDTLKDPELVLGQSYFIPQEDGYRWEVESFKNQFNFVLLPTLKEYSYNEPSALVTIIGENLADGIQDTEEFIAAFSAEFSP